MLIPGSYAFRYAEPLPYMLLDSIGWQTAESPDYSNDGLARSDAGHLIFQYTLSGEGAIELAGETFPLRPGTAFLVTSPSPHRYYYAGRDGQPWEFIWLNAKGEDAVRLWNRLLERRSPLLSLASDASPIARFWSLYRTVSVDRVTDSAALSALLYEWMLSLFAPARSLLQPEQRAPSPIDLAKRFMRERFADDLSLADIASHSGVSRAYLCRLFQRQEKISPLEYLRRRRVEAAVTMLRRTELSAREIGRRCGFESPSYFGQVFRHYLGLSPSAYRHGSADYPFDTLFLE
ncbi:AraC family transcriptional regulator [Cohnella nanjingensis]|uniref:AraC family transcriptional regulator n=1 Tax=Cohnella nanjingensis TaxID=1387779 RepID=A0A7X0RVY6_9BACL|nr:AraC family transcriptional regulator [Cohnella nanjingensis]MBB6673114.1 AraC family transcriptional regulator [Cohnella nanjingensis]